MKKLIIALSFILILTSCQGTWVAKVGDTKISKEEFNFYLTSIKSQMSSTELSTDEDWQTQEIEGVKAIDIAKDRALESASENISYIEVAKYFGINLSSEDNEKVRQMIASIRSQYGGSVNYKKALKELGVTDDFFKQLCESQIFSEKLALKALEEKPLTPDEEDEIFLGLGVEGKFNAKHILFSIVDDNRVYLGEEVDKQKKLEAEETYKKILAGEDFDKLMNELSEDPGLKSNPDGYIFGEGKMVTEFENAVKSLKAGGVTLVKSDLGYHIIKRLPLDKTYFADDIKMTAMAERLVASMPGWKEEAGITIEKNEKVLESIK